MMTTAKATPFDARKLALVLAVAGFSMAALAGCNTVDGAGEDIESTGEAIQESSD
jgi:entericidin B